MAETDLQNNLKDRPPSEEAIGVGEGGSGEAGSGEAGSGKAGSGEALPLAGPEAVAPENQADGASSGPGPGHRLPPAREKALVAATGPEEHETRPAATSAGKPTETNEAKAGLGQKLLALYLKLKAFWQRLPTLSDSYVWFLNLFGLRLKPEKMLRRARELAIREKWTEAVDAYRQVIIFRPLNVMAYGELGQVYQHLGQTEQAETELAIAINLEILIADRHNLEAAAKLVKALVKKGQPHQAISLVEPILVNHLSSPGNFELLKAMAAAYNLTRQKKKAGQLYRAGLAQYPKEADFYLLKGERDLKEGQNREGEYLLSVGRILAKIKNNPNDAGALTSLGELYVSENRPQDGLPLLAQAADLEPENIGLKWRLFNLHQKSREPDEALKYLLAIVALQPDDEVIRYRLADFYRKNKRLDEALAIYRRLAAAHPFDPRPHEILSETLTEAGEFEKGQEYSELAKILSYGLKSRPTHRESLAFMNFLFSTGREKSARQWLEKSLVKWPHSGELLLSKIKISYGEGRYQEAISLIKRLLSVKNDVAEAHMWLALCHQRKGNHLTALSEAQLATRLAPKSFTVHQVLGDILKEQKKLSPANAAYEIAAMLRKGLVKSVVF